MKQLLSLLILGLSVSTLAANNYYPADIQAQIENGQLKNEALKEALFEVVSSTHQTNGNGPDTLGCDSRKKGSCYSPIVLGYKGARKVLFGKLHLEQDAKGYYVKDVYCNKEIRNSQTKVGPGIIPNSNILNCEHTWPQSKFTGRFGNETQKSDLHHLYPTDSRANSVRGNYKFADVDGFEVGSDCKASHTEGNGGDFEPPTEHKGNVARALFYFAVRYQMDIDPKQEATLRRWHDQDPVDAEEMERNDGIYEVQNNRNPFIDYPHLIDSISNI